MEPSGSPRPRFEELAHCLGVLANPSRLRLLQQMVSPKTVSEMSLKPRLVRRGENPERRISPQAVRLHLEQLDAVGLLEARKIPRGGSFVEEFGINYPRLFAIGEEFRKLGNLRPREALESAATIVGERFDSPRPEPGPALVIVRGFREGTAFALTSDNWTPQRGWLIGRRKGVAVCVDYDPFLSAENTEIRTAPDGGFEVETLSTGRNGTTLNWQALVPKQPRRLVHGDLVGVGRTFLWFRQRVEWRGSTSSKARSISSAP